MRVLVCLSIDCGHWTLPLDGIFQNNSITKIHSEHAVCARGLHPCWTQRQRTIAVKIDTKRIIHSKCQSWIPTTNHNTRPDLQKPPGALLAYILPLLSWVSLSVHELIWVSGVVCCVSCFDYCQVCYVFPLFVSCFVCLVMHGIAILQWPFCMSKVAGRVVTRSAS